MTTSTTSPFDWGAPVHEAPDEFVEVTIVTWLQARPFPASLTQYVLGLDGTGRQLPPRGSAVELLVQHIARFEGLVEGPEDQLTALGAWTVQLAVGVDARDAVPMSEMLPMAEAALADASAIVEQHRAEPSPAVSSPACTECVATGRVFSPEGAMTDEVCPHCDGTGVV